MLYANGARGGKVVDASMRWHDADSAENQKFFGYFFSKK